MSFLLQAHNVSYSYKAGEPVLQNVSFSIEEGDFVAITGPSGSGKSTLFYLLGTLVSKFKGDITFQGKSYRSMSAEDKAIFRNKEIGFVFQQFHLMPRASVLDNILLPTFYPYDNSRPTNEDIQRAKELAGRLGIEELLERQPQELSGGQQQRVAIARALLRSPQLILADEPTGNLDSHSSEAVMEVFKKLHEEGKTIVLITHSSEVAEKCSRVIRFRDGQIESDVRNSQFSVVPRSEKTKTHRLSAASLAVLSYLRALRPAWNNIVRTKTKSFLTTLGIVLGIAAVLTTMSLGDYAKDRILQSYQSLGVNNLSLFGYHNWRRSSSDFVPVVFRSFDWDDDLKPLSQIFSEIERLSPVMSIGGPTLNYGGRSYSENTLAMGVNEHYYFITDQSVAQGRALSFFDVEHSNPVCTIGSDILKELFPGKQDPIDKTLTLVIDETDVPCRIIGVMNPQSSQSEFQPNSQVFLPYTYLQKSVTSFWQTRIREARMKIREGYDPEGSGKQIEGFFRSRYGSTGVFNSHSNAKVIAQMNLFLSVFSSLLTAVALVALLVGCVGINNMMFVNLSERLKEIGLRKALGATPSQIRALVLTESLVLCALGGAIGLFGGFVAYHGLIYAATKLIPDMPFEWVVRWPAILISCGAIVLSGICSGLIPALRAERLEVIEALRQE